MPDASDLPSLSRALVPLIRVSPASDPRLARARRMASFLAHLIASQERVPQAVPQAREKRRADPAEVIAAYQATIARLRQSNSQ
jgi:hypothetical protein